MYRICFPLVAQWHQAFHALPIAAALSRRPGIEVRVAVATPEVLPRIRALASDLGARDIVFETMWPEATVGVRPSKLALLARMAWRLHDMDAIVVPERTSLVLRRMGVKTPLFIHTDHGAGDRAVGYERRIRLFDHVLIAGEKQEQRMLRAGLIRPGAYDIVGYPKFDAVAAKPPSPAPVFDRIRPTVFYNPHFKESLGSWATFGPAVLAAFAAQDRYNLIFAPHVRLNDERGEALLRMIAPYVRARNIHVDLGGDRACDMTYTEYADVYAGDVSSQVYEFIRRPRPCVFFDAHGVDWRGDENYAHWALGPVATSQHDIIAAVDHAVVSHGDYAEAQASALRRTFDMSDTPASERAADAVEQALARGCGRATLRRTAKRRATSVAAPAGVTACLAAGLVGWWAGAASLEWTAPDGLAVPAYVDEAMRTHRTRLMRVALEAAQVGADDTGAAPPAPTLPSNWKVLDADVLPSDHGPALNLVLRGEDGERLHLFAVNADARSDDAPMLARRGGATAVFWEAGRQAYVLTGGETADGLLRNARRISQERPS